MDFSDENRILMKNLNIFKGYRTEQNTYSQLSKWSLGTVGTEQTLKTKLEETGKMKWQHWKHTESLLFFYSVIFMNIII